MTVLYKLVSTLLVAAASALLPLNVYSAQEAPAAEFPNKPVRLIVSYPPGGGADTMARLLANALTEDLGWNMVVENRPGAGGTIGIGALARMQPDGYTIGIGETSNLAINPLLYPHVSYDAERDFEPVAPFTAQPMVLMTLADSPYKTVAELIGHAKANPARLTLGNVGPGTVGDITGRFFAKETDIDILHVPYKGAAAVMNDFLGGRVDVFFAAAPVAMGHLDNPRIRMLAVTTAAPIPQFPGVPPLADTIVGFESAAHSGVLVPARTPEPIKKRLNAAINQVLGNPALRERIMAQGNIVLGGDMQDFARIIKQDTAKWSEIIKASDLRLD